MSVYRIGMYVRLPFDRGHENDPRIFLLGQINSIDNAGGTLNITLHDPFQYVNFFQDVPDTLQVYADTVTRCGFYPGGRAVYLGQSCRVLGYRADERKDFKQYFLQHEGDNSVQTASETEVILPFVSPDISPLHQMLRGEWQNPRWYVRRSIVSRSIHLLTTSLSGFSRLAGCKINILPHQLLTIRRCLLKEPCRYMLADEVGMGKTVEALGVLRIYVDNHPKCRILILVPGHLLVQWRLEMLFKFDLSENSRKYTLVLAAKEEVDKLRIGKWDFLIADEIHHALYNEKDYRILQILSQTAVNVLLLSATPLQARGTEYLRLLRLLDPRKYNDLTEADFQNRLAQQNSIEQATFHVGRALNAVKDIVKESDNPFEDEDVDDEVDSLKERLHKLQQALPQDIYVAEKINSWRDDYNSHKCGSPKDLLQLSKLAQLLGYISEHYQLDANIIRNRRAMMGRATERKIIPLPCSLESKNNYAREVFQAVTVWLEQTEEDAEYGSGLLAACFSSAFAADTYLRENAWHLNSLIPADLQRKIQQWLQYEQLICEDICSVMDEEGDPSSKICAILACLDRIISLKDKVVLFTDYIATWESYKTCLEDYFGAESVALYRSDDSPDEREGNVYRFQGDSNCQFLLVDASGGEGHNFQMADFAVHLDLPWDVSVIEQRIGRLDRLGRTGDTPITSIVPYAINTVEEHLFRLFHEGLQVFTQPLSGLEIIMGELRDMTQNALTRNPFYGLQEILPTVKEKARLVQKSLQRERIYDLNIFRFNDLDRRIRDLVNKYNRQGDALFAEAMTSWASLAGFRTKPQANGLIQYSANDFSFASAWQTLLIPPRWDEFYQDERHKAIIKIQSSVMSDNTVKTRTQQGFPSIVGTFDRNCALLMDSAHFFAPGDPVFDCIINNALASYRGRCSAFRLSCDVNWQGFVFSYIFRPNYDGLYELGETNTLCRPYVSFLCNEVYNVFIPLPGQAPASDEVKIGYQRCFQSARLNADKAFIHLGQRSRSKAVAEAKSQGLSNAQWLHSNLPSSDWILKKAREAEKDAYKYLRGRSRLNDAIRRINEDFEVANQSVSSLQAENIIRTLREATAYLDAVAYVWMEAET